ncbi:methyl-accepting chemotaxis protein [Sutcliffiella rhizosphaerae]|uniref:Methyl-accepting chemotaxis protein McpC n=1 Tax=Sutcliffiella rhizosphaerae TaxID=2880967 RepID=A0ABN8ABT8_9BACI|nr:methyl-accepting chemotaxis protein [Sutcliffiella rhizosphaerae]CAG9620125.1 Methyl-accepting chemotaxis protein McpC [Sutcliffiella rhizosphaerae]
MEEKGKYRYGLRFKLVLFITILALITYSISGVFIYVVANYVENFIEVGVFTIITLVLGVAWSGILAFFAARYITKPLQNLEAVAQKAANGDLTIDVPVSTSRDEISALGSAFNLMLHNLRDMVKTIDQTFEKTNKKVEEISEVSISASEQAESISLTIEEIAKGAESSASSVQDTAESVEDVIKIADEVHEKATSSQQLSEEMVKDLDESKEVIHSLVSGIQKLAGQNQTSLQAVERLEKNAKEVENIISLVGDIAGQTNLLALNASIEAARAGEHGRGFAVVAEEVRSLADESAKAVQGISELIKNIQEEVKNVVTQITEQVKAANEEAGKGTATNEVIAEMTNSVMEVAASVKQIATLVDRQMDSIQTTARQSQEVAAIAEETSAGAEEVTATTHEQASMIASVERISHELAGEASNMKRMIAKFRV